MRCGSVCSMVEQKAGAVGVFNVIDIHHSTRHPHRIYNRSAVAGAYGRQLGYHCQPVSYGVRGFYNLYRYQTFRKIS